MPPSTWGGEAGFVYYQRGDVAGGDVRVMDVAAQGVENNAAVICGGQIGQATHRDARRFTAAAGHRHAGDALERGGSEGVGQLADILGDDRVDDALGLALDPLRSLEAAAQTGDDDRVLILRGVIDRLLLGVGRGFGLGKSRSRPCGDQQRRRSENHGFQAHRAYLPWRMSGALGGPLFSLELCNRLRLLPSDLSYQ